jgi:hypothetical protein
MKGHLMDRDLLYRTSMCVMHHASTGLKADDRLAEEEVVAGKDDTPVECTNCESRLLLLLLLE